MHSGNIHNIETKEGQLYAYLADHAGQWFSGWDLLQVIKTTAVSTFISSIRLQLADGAGESIEHKTRRNGKRMLNFYRLVRGPREPEQQRLF